MPVEISDEERMRRAVITLRHVIRDKPELNRLLLGNAESTDAELRQCLIMALIDWNQSPPVLGFVDLASHPNKFLLLQCAAIEALTSAGIWHSREHMPSSDGGTSGDDHAKAAEYGAWIERYTADYERKKVDLKTALNISAALGNMGVRSEYSWRIYGLQGEEW
jgi:hypothetical protein